nr:ubiquinone biosynthesis protein COQ9, mitochondrial-like [Leptinotarsa decemlineata]
MVLIAFAASIMLRRFNLRSNSKLIVWQVTRLSSTDSSSIKECNEPTYEDGIRNKILASSLPFVPELEWSKEAISNGAECIGYPAISHGMFTRGGADLVHYFQTSSNSKLVDILKKIQEECKENPILPGEFAEKAIQARLKMIQPYISKWPQAIAIMSILLLNIITMEVRTSEIHHETLSITFKQRIGIAGVYKATELYMIRDKSDEFLSKWTFLNRHLAEAVQLHDLLCKNEVTIQSAKETVQSVFITARNILGLNWNR